MIFAEFFKKWLKPGRIVPLLTVSAAVSFGLMGLFDFIKLTVPESVIVMLLTLLAIDALVERINILERIERKLESRPFGHLLRKRQSIQTPEEFGRYAFSMHILAISGISIIKQFENFYRQKIQDGCSLECILLKPDDAMIDIWKKQNLGSSSTNLHVASSLGVLRQLCNEPASRGSCVVKLLDMFPPFSIVGMDFGRNTARMIVEFHGYKTASDQRAHILLSKEEDPFWFEFYMKQFSLAWTDSKEVDWGSLAVIGS